MTPARPRTLALLLALAVAAAWAPALRGDFVWDDQHDIVHSDRLHHARAMLDVFRHHAMWSADQPETAVATYRPLALASLALDYQLWALHPAGYHATSILLHVLATLALFLAFRRLLFAPADAASPAERQDGHVAPTDAPSPVERQDGRASDLPAAALALLFAFHPANAEAVAWINGRSEVLALAFGALSLWAAAARRPLGLALFLLLAMLSKETGALFVPLAIAVAWLEPNGDGGERLRPSWPPIIAACAALAAYVGLRAGALGHSALPSGALGDAARALPALWLRATQAAVVPLDRAPVTLSSWLHALGTGERIVYAVASAAILAILAALVVRRHLVAALGLAWWLGALVPTTAVVILDYPWPGLARWLYIGLPGLILCIYCAAAQRLRPRGRLILFSIVAALWLVAAERAIPTWRSDTQLYATMVEESPDDAWAWRALGINQLGLRHYAEAAPLFHKAAEVDHTDEVHAAYALEAFTWTYLDRCDEAVAQFRAHPPTPAVETDLFAEGAAACYSRAGRLDRARQLYRSCASTRPTCQSALDSFPAPNSAPKQSR
jgi:hypothetical protein